MERSSNRVLLLEAGPRDRTLGSSLLSWKIHMPAALMYNLCDDRYNWFLSFIGCLQQIIMSISETIGFSLKTKIYPLN